MAVLYQIDMPDMKYIRQHSININNTEYRFLFTFSDEMFQMWQDFETTNKMRAKSDPLVTVSGTKEYIKNYTYIEYYMSISDADTVEEINNDIDTWLTSQVVLPVSIARLSDEDKKTELLTRIVLSRELDEIRTQYKVMCRWQFTLYRNGDIVCDGFVEKGAWFMPYDEVSLSFEYDMDYIGYNDIQNVRMFMRVN